jgi:hypothetical protein
VYHSKLVHRALMYSAALERWIASRVSQEGGASKVCLLYLPQATSCMFALQHRPNPCRIEVRGPLHHACQVAN